jgi:microcystin-dependent protein
MEGTIAEIRMFAGNFAPRGWAFCQGQILSIAQNTALFSLLGTTYGGNGQTTFALPDLRSRVPVGTGQGPGLTSINLGELSGVESVTLLASQMPAHQHTIGASSSDATTGKPGGKVLAATSTAIYAPSPDGTFLAPTGIAGSSQPVAIRNPYLGMNYIICMEGIFPSRN